MPLAVGVPLIVYVPELNEPDIPEGNPVTLAPVAPPPIAYTILVPNAVFWQTADVAEPEESEIVWAVLEFTVKTPLTFGLAYPPYCQVSQVPCLYRKV